MHVTGLAPLQTPAWQESVRVQALASSQAVPFGFEGLEQRPVEGLQIPALWHWSCAEQLMGFVPRHAPL